MAEISNVGLTGAQITRLNALLEKQFNTDDGVKTQREIIEAMPEKPTKEIINGMIDWSRRKFNRMDYREQAAYQARLEAKRYYVVGSMIVPKMVFDAVIGAISRNDHERKAA